MRTDSLDYVLPPDRVATAPAEPRDAARLLVVRRSHSAGADPVVEHRSVRDLPRLGILRPGDLMIVNTTRVLPAYFECVRYATGGRVRGLYLESDAEGCWVVLLESGGKLQQGERLDLTPTATLTLAASRGRGQWQCRVESDLSTLTLLDRIGKPPLPPYIRKARTAAGLPDIAADDAARYNTVYAREPGSVAAPTAGLHLTPRVLDELAASGVERAEVVLRVGLGTFEPIRADDLSAHQMHREWMHVPAATLAALQRTRDRGGRIFVVGTTTLRALESLPPSLDDLPQGYTTDTGLFIHPGLTPPHRFRFADIVLTNFHLPRSTLLALIAALPGVGLDQLKQWYAMAINAEYRFYSYGDAMLLA